MAQPVTPQEHVAASAKRILDQRAAAAAVRDELAAKREADRQAAQAAQSTVEK